ncbi:MAG TPA: iron-containing alcohol dehydrogenase [Caulobacteraceae bacterium]|jgi:maleylacetate reductase
MLSGVHRQTQLDRVVYGRPALQVLAELLQGYGKTRALVVSTKSLSGPQGLASEVASGLGERCVGLYGGVSAHSPRDGVIAAADEARRTDADILVAIGGSSVTDACKVVQLAVWNGLTDVGELDPYRAGVRDGARSPAPGADPLRMIAIPTTLSAAEFTPFGGVTDTRRHAKEGYAHPLYVPRAVILDPQMTRATPPELWFSTGIKAVDHCVETLCSLTRAPYADALASHGLELLAEGLRASKGAPDDLDARLQCQLGMWLAISGASAGQGLGASHAIGHTLGGMLGVPHGITSCVALPAVLAWNAGANDAADRLVAQLIGLPERSAAEAVKTLCRELALPTSLGAVGVEPAQFEAIAAHTMTDRGVRSNPRPIRSAADVVEILKLAA